MEVFASDIQKAQLWLKELKEIGNFRDESQAYSVLRIVLHALRDRLPINTALNLGGQLPLIIAGAYYQGWNPDGTPTDEKTIDDFIQKVFPQLSRLEVDNENSIKATCSLLEKKLNPGQIDNIRDVLPEKLKQLFS